MKIVIFVDYSNIEFNKDFQVSNRLINAGHNIFLAINDVQFEELRNRCDKAYIGYSRVNCGYKFPSIAEFDN